MMRNEEMIMEKDTSALDKIVKDWNLMWPIDTIFVMEIFDNKRELS
jgi:hypothetical protein